MNEEGEEKIGSAEGLSANFGSVPLVSTFRDGLYFDWVPKFIVPLVSPLGDEHTTLSSLGILDSLEFAGTSEIVFVSCKTRTVGECFVGDEVLRASKFCFSLGLVIPCKREGFGKRLCLEEFLESSPSWPDSLVAHCCNQSETLDELGF